MSEPDLEACPTCHAYAPPEKIVRCAACAATTCPNCLLTHDCAEPPPVDPDNYLNRNI